MPILESQIDTASDDYRRNREKMLLAIAAQYHGFEFLEQIRQAVFSTLELPDSETWTLRVCPQCVADYQSQPAEGHFGLMTEVPGITSR